MRGAVLLMRPRFHKSFPGRPWSPRAQLLADHSQGTHLLPSRSLETSYLPCQCQCKWSAKWSANSRTLLMPDTTIQSIMLQGVSQPRQGTAGGGEPTSDECHVLIDPHLRYESRRRHRTRWRTSKITRTSLTPASRMESIS